jgi:hypothetical protein
MIDQNLIDTNIKSLRNSVVSAKSINDKYLYQISNCFDKAILIKVQNYIEQVPASSWHRVQYQESSPRQVIRWQADSVVEELHRVFDSITDLLRDRYLMPINFYGVQLWKDKCGFVLYKHKDDPIIDVALQIYLFDCPPQFGTTFHWEPDQCCVIPFEHNTGYISRNDASDSMTHELTDRIPFGVTRYSLFATWGLQPKR